MTDETIKKISDLKARLDSVKEYDQEIAEDIVNEVLCYMIDIYEEDYYDKIPEEDNETISIYAYYKRGLKYSDDADFSMIINGQCYANRPGDTCARNFDVLKSVARSEGMDVRILSKEELAIFSIILTFILILFNKIKNKKTLNDKEESISDNHRKIPIGFYLCSISIVMITIQNYISCLFK